MITGKNLLSNEVLNYIHSFPTSTLTEISEQFNLSIDQVKKLKRYYNYSSVVDDKFNAEIAAKFKSLGLNGLILGPFFKADNFKDLELILSNLDAGSSLVNIKQAISNNERKNRLLEKANVDYEYKKRIYNEELLNMEKTFKSLNSQLNEVIKPLERFKHLDEFAFIKEHVIYHNEEWLLKKRLDSRYRRSLVKKGIIALDNYVYKILDIESFVKQSTYRFKRGLNVLWDESRESNQLSYNPNGTVEYGSVKRLGIIDIVNLEKLLAKLEDEIKVVSKLLVELELDAVRTSNHINSYILKSDSIKYQKLLKITMKWLYERGFVVSSGFLLPNNFVIDVAGYNANNEVIFIEIVFNPEEISFHNINKYCCQYYVLPLEDSHINDINYGLINCDDLIGIYIVNEAPYSEAQDNIVFQMNRFLSQNFISK